MIAVPERPGWCLVPIGERERAELDELFSACDDYVRLTEGRSPSSHQADELLRELPPGRRSEDKHVFAVRDGSGRLVGAVDVVRDYPAKGDWFLGLELLHPSVRGAGAGEHVYRSVESWVVSRGALAMWIAVLQANPRARRFWDRVGFRAVAERRVGIGERDHVAVRMTRRLDDRATSASRGGAPDG